MVDSKRNGEMGKERWAKFVDGRAWVGVHMIKMEGGEAMQRQRTHLDTNSHFLSPAPGDSVPELWKTPREGYYNSMESQAQVPPSGPIFKREV